MHLLLTDLLTCPRCGPPFGLIVQSDRVDNRDVIEGRLGCANCRETFVISGGVADLRHATVGALEPTASVEADADRAFRTAALLGIKEANRAILVADPQGVLARPVSRVLPGIHVIGAAVGQGSLPATSADREAEAFLSQILMGARVPLRDTSLDGMALIGIDPAPLLEEVLRTLKPGGRLLLDQVPAEMAETLRKAGFEVHLEQEGVVVAAASDRR